MTTHPLCTIISLHIFQECRMYELQIKMSMFILIHRRTLSWYLTSFTRFIPFQISYFHFLVDIWLILLVREQVRHFHTPQQISHTFESEPIFLHNFDCRTICIHSWCPSGFDDHNVAWACTVWHGRRVDERCPDSFTC